jgi:hypothetical protein
MIDYCTFIYVSIWRNYITKQRFKRKIFREEEEHVLKCSFIYSFISLFMTTRVNDNVDDWFDVK